MTSNHDAASPIAIIGMGLRLPGGISTPEQFWTLLVNKKDGRCRVPISRYNVDGFYSEKTHQQNVATQYGYFLDVQLGALDTSFFSGKRAEVNVTDPQLRLLLEVVWECMESAGQAKLRGTNTGVFVGVFGEDWHNILHKDNQMKNTYRVLSAGDYALSNVLSHDYDLRGPSMTIRTACSSSMSSLHIACQALRNGDCPTAIVAGSSIILDPTMTLDMSEQGVLSPSGSCKTFDAAADGFARGEAVNAILIKPLADAVRDGDPIRAVIRSTAVNSDGKTPHIGSPSSEAQEAMIRRAYEVAGIKDFSQTPFIECHGTGTIRGDPIEVAAVASVFGGSGAYIGSVKPNLGHGEGAAGLTSIIKAVLSLENETIPPNINFSTPNPKIPFREYKLEVPVEPIPWPKDRHPRVSVSSFGFGGANGHVIIDSAASFGIQRPTIRGRIQTSSGKSNGDSKSVCAWASDESSDELSDETPNETPDDSSIETSDDFSDRIETEAIDGTTRQPKESCVVDSVRGDTALGNIQPLVRLIPVSASSERSLQTRVNDLRQYIEAAGSGSLDNIAFTLGLRRVHLPHRTFGIVSQGTKSLLEFNSFQKVCASTGKDGSIAYVFTGQGAQWLGMGKSLVQGSSTFLKDIQEMDQALQQLDDPPQWLMEELLCSSDDSLKDDVGKSELAQPLCTAIQVALVNLLSKCGIVPGAVIGHSSGEIAAAYTAGAMTMSEAIICAYLRGLVTKLQTRTGSMAAIGMDRDTVMPYLVEGALVACENSPKSVTISGDSGAIEQTLVAINTREPDVFTRKLHVNVAYHSHHMCEIGDTYEKMLTPCISPRKAIHPFYSTVFARLLSPKTQLDPAYWRSNLESPVLFHTTMQQLLDDLPHMVTILEIGPHAALQGPIRQILRARKSKISPAYIPTLLRDKDSALSVLTTLGHLYARGHMIDFSFINPKAFILTNLPNYPWDRKDDLWLESRLSRAWRLRKHPHHELLGSRCVETTDFELMWRNELHLYDVPWLSDHKLGENVVFPIAGHIAIMGEALRQVLGSDAYVLKNVMVKAALILSETENIEIMTSMRPYRLTETTNSSSWYELSISTFNGKCWVENCIAHGKAGDEDSSLKKPSKTITPNLRIVPEDYFYSCMQQVDFRYGPRFQGLTDVSTDTDKPIAVGSLQNDESKYEASYAVHPTVIDCCIQLAVVAGCNGIARNLFTPGVPVDFQCVIVRPGGPNLLAEATMDPATKVANAVAVVKESNELVVKIENGRCIPFDTGDGLSGKAVTHAARIEWLPDIDCLNHNGLIKRIGNKRHSNVAIEMFSSAVILQVLDILQSFDISLPGHLVKYVSWLEREKDIIIKGEGGQIVPEAKQWASMHMDARQSLLDRLLDKVVALGNPRATDLARTFQKLARRDTVEAIFVDGLKPLELLLENDNLRNFYCFQGEGVSADEFLHLCAHSQPTLNVLEVGAGTGASTETIMNSLISDDGVRMYSQYIFADVSSEFFSSAKKRFENCEAMEYKVLDIERNPAEQGFELGSFDLIVASNVLHETSSLKTSLKNMRSLLRPGGRIYLQELVAPINWRSVTLITGLFPSWWVGEDECRMDGPCISVERWDKELRDSGFSGANTAILDDDSPYYTNAHITSTAIAPAIKTKPVTFLYRKTKHEFASKLAEMFEQEGIPVQWNQLGNSQHCIEGQDVISMIELESPYFDDISERDYVIFMDYLSNLKGGILWLTRSAQIACTDPRYGAGIGLIRTIRTELGVDFWTTELQTLDSAGAVATIAICKKFCSRPPIDGGLGRGLDTEYSVHDGIVRVGRYHWFSTSKELESQVQAHGPKQLTIGRYGSIDALRWTQRQPNVVHANEVEVDIRCVGLNFRDVMVVLGIVPSDRDSLGLDAAGVVTRVGAGVDHLKVGDRVFSLSTGLFVTRKVLDAKDVVCFPENFSFEEAVSMPLVYMTAIHAIMNLGQLKKGQSILIHSATGGVGQAAINISQMLGAEVYATVGTEEKVQYLIDNHNIHRERILHSRNDSFLHSILQATEGRGVDIVLNSLSGDLLHASWNCVAKGGRMMEIGKRDMLEHGRVALDMFSNNRTFHGIDLNNLSHDNPDLFAELRKKLACVAAGGFLKPIQPIHAFPAQRLPDAFRLMKRGQHIGKIIVTMPEDATEIAAAVSHQASFLSSTSTYLLIGGLGGLGKEVARWMVEKGARSLCFLSRSAGGSDKHQIFFRELESQGCRVTAVAGSVAEVADVEKAIAAVPTPIAGVMQMSMVLRDLPILQTSYDDWKTVQDPKVKGTWNLHNTLSGAKLDFFILLGSLSGVLGQPGQANYASANTFLDSFTQYRHSLGLPCSVVDLGGVEGIGFLATRPEKLQKYRSHGLFLLQEQHLMDSIQIAMIRSAPTDGLSPAGQRGAFTSMSQFAVGLRSSRAFSDPRNRVIFSHDVRFSLYGNMDPAGQLNSEPRDAWLSEFLSQAEANPGLLDEPDTLKHVSCEIGRTLFAYLVLPVEDMDITMTLESLGVDSLVSIEIRNWWRRSLGLDITVLEILNAGTLEGLGKAAISSLKEKYSSRKNGTSDSVDS